MSAEAPTAPQPAPAEPPISPVAALVGTVAAPVKTFARLAKNPTWWLPLVISLLVTGIAYRAIAPKIDVERTVREAMEKQAEKRGGTVSDADVARAMSFSEKFSRWWVIVAGGAVFFFLIGLVYWGVVQAFGGETRFAQVLAVWSHAGIPGIVAGLLKIPVFLARPDASVTQKEAESVFMSSVGSFLPLDAPAALRALGSSLDIFTIACLALIVIGFQQLPGMKKGTGAAAALVPWALVVVVKTIWAAVFG